MNDSNKKLLGDQIAGVLEKTGISELATKAANAVGVKDCGCKKRQEQLNNLHKKVNNLI